MAFDQLLSSVAGQASGGGGSYGTTHEISTAVPINVNSMGCNIGQILQGITGANGATGGYDVSLPSRLGYLPNNRSESSLIQPVANNANVAVAQTTTDMNKWLMIGGGGLLALILLMKRR